MEPMFPCRNKPFNWNTYLNHGICFGCGHDEGNCLIQQDSRPEVMDFCVLQFIVTLACGNQGAAVQSSGTM